MFQETIIGKNFIFGLLKSVSKSDNRQGTSDDRQGTAYLVYLYKGLMPTKVH